MVPIRNGAECALSSSAEIAAAMKIEKSALFFHEPEFLRRVQTTIVPQQPRCEERRNWGTAKANGKGPSDRR